MTIEKDPSEIMRLCDIVRQTGFDLRQFLGQGHLEKVYENGLANRLRKKGILAQQQVPVLVHDEDGTVLGDSWQIFSSKMS